MSRRRNHRRSDRAVRVANDARAPAPERRDAATQVARDSLASQLIPPPQIQRVIDWAQDQYRQQRMSKAAGQGVLIPLKRRRERGMQSVYLDDLRIFAQAEYWDKPGPVGFRNLREMVEGTPILAAIIGTRIHQVTRFCRPQEHQDSPGFVVCHSDPNHEPDNTEETSLKLLTRFVNNCGWEFDPWARKRLRRDTFAQFISKSLRDSLTMDAAPIEIEMKRDRNLGVDGYYAVDGATIRLCSEEGYRGDDEIYAAQVIDGRVRTLYRHEDLIYEPRNPRTNVELAGYGLSECELLIRVVTGILNAMNYNIRGFTDNAIPRGVLHLTGDYDAADLNAFRRYWNAMVKGINNSWTVPVLVAKDPESAAKFENFGVEYNEMYFSKWMTFLTSIACAIYSMGPEEINFESFTAGRAPLSGSDTEQKLTSSSDKGLIPILSYYESLISSYILGSISDKYVLRFRGLHPEDKEKRFEMRKEVLTVNEARAHEGFDEWPGKDGLGDAPLNPTLMQVWQAQKQQEQQAAQEDFGQEQVPGMGAVERPDQTKRRSGGDTQGQGPDNDVEHPAVRDFGRTPGTSAHGDFGGKSLRIYTIE